MAAKPSSTTLPDAEWSPQAAVCAWLWPGLGHIVLGERRRGVLIMIGMCCLILVGTLVGGVDSVDRRQDGYWFMAQMFCGPVVFGLEWVNQAVVRPQELDWTDEDLREAFIENDPALIRHLERRSLGRVNEMGTLFIAMAGLMNLVVILDALHFRPRQTPDSGGQRRQATPQRRSTDAPPDADGPPADRATSVASSAETDAGGATSLHVERKEGG